MTDISELEKNINRKPYGINPPLTEIDVLVYEHAVKEFKQGRTYNELACDFIKDALAVDYGYVAIASYRWRRPSDKQEIIDNIRREMYGQA